MANKLLISLISEQTIPNVEFLKWYASKYSDKTIFDLLFISTEKMEESGRSQEIMKALESLDFPYDYHYTVTVEQNEIKDVESQIKYFFDDYPHESVVANITGGTKIMSLGVYQFVKDIKDSEIYYKPIDDVLEQIYPKVRKINENLGLSIDEYMKAVGCEYRIEPSKNYSFEYVQKVHDLLFESSDSLYAFNKITEKNEDGSFNLVTQRGIAETRDELIRIDEAIELCKKLGINPESIPVYFPKYILGGWYEDFVYYQIKKEYNLLEENIIRNLVVYTGVNNEFDVVFTYGGKLHVVECKAFMHGSIEGEKINKALYKLISLREKLGKGICLYLYTTAKHIPDNNRLRAIQGNVILRN